LTSWTTISISRRLLIHSLLKSHVRCVTIHLTYTIIHILPCRFYKWGSGDYFFFLWGETESTWYCGHCLAYCTSPQMINDDDYGAIGGMRNGRGNRSTRRKPALVPLCPPRLPHDLTRAGTRVAAVGSRRLTSWAKARPFWRLSRSDVTSVEAEILLPNSENSYVT
jgi:hypothetical protein